MNKKLKKAIFEWLYENENEFQLVNSCVEHFKDYIYDKNGEYLIGGDVVSSFIDKAEKLLYWH